MRAAHEEPKGCEDFARAYEYFVLWFIFLAIILRQKWLAVYLYVWVCVCVCTVMCVRWLRHITASTIIAEQLNNEQSVG